MSKKHFFLVFLVLLIGFTQFNFGEIAPSCCNIDSENCCCPDVDEFCQCDTYLVSYSCVCSDGVLLEHVCVYKRQQKFVFGGDPSDGSDWIDQSWTGPLDASGNPMW